HPFSTITGHSVIGEDCVIGPMTQVRDSTVGDGCRIERSHLEQVKIASNVTIGPFSRLRPGTELAEGVPGWAHPEIENSKSGAAPSPTQREGRQAKGGQEIAQSRVGERVSETRPLTPEGAPRQPGALKLLSGEANPELARRIGEVLGEPVAAMRITRFADGEY